MMNDRYRETAYELLGLADVQIDGTRPWDIRVHDPRVFRRILSGGSLAFGESYMDGWWDCDALDQCIERVLRTNLDQKIRNRKDLLLRVMMAKISNPQSIARAFDIGERHYDLGNDLFRTMLDDLMVYSCGYWKNAGDLNEAQEQKLDLICRKLGLTSGGRLLDIGCGWGGLAKYAAEKYGVEVVGVTVSKQQAAFARDFCEGLPVDIRLQDYRSLDETFGNIVSVGMFEHVGSRNYSTFMETVHRCLEPEGRCLLHTIGGNTSVTTTEPWIAKYIFPNSMLPSAKQIAATAEGLFVLDDWHSFGHCYDTTLMAWHENFAEGWPQLSDRYDERFYRMWTYYLLACAGSFRANKNQVWQIVFSPLGSRGGYESVR